MIASYGFLISAQEGFDSSSDVFSDSSATDDSASSTTSDGLTAQVAQQLSDLTTNADSNGEDISLDQLKSIISDSVGKSFSESDLPSIDPSEIKIEKQNYTGTTEQIKSQKKEDFINYMSAVFYIFSSSSPKPITNSDDLTTFSNYVIQTITASLTTRDSSGLTELSQSGQKMLDQLKDVEVPEDVLDIHVKALKFAKYAIALKPEVDANASDPLGDLVNISKMESFAEALVSFSTEAQTKFDEYGVSYDDAIKGKLETLGVTAPKLDESAVTNTSTDTSSDSN
jgi:hypothetical protein